MTDSGSELGQRTPEVRALRDALERVVPILENAEQAFREPPIYNDPSLTGWRYEALASGIAIGLRVVREALAGSAPPLESAEDARVRFGECALCFNALERPFWDTYCFACQEESDDEEFEEGAA